MNGKLLAVAIALILVFPAGAQAVSFPGGGGGPTTSGSGGGYSNGSVPWYELQNAQYSAARSPVYREFGSGGSGLQRSLQWVPELETIRTSAQSNNRRLGRASYWSRSTGAVLRASCGTPISAARGSNCPLWWNERRTTNFNDPVTWLNVHATAPTGGIGIENQLAGYNVRVWRENPARQRFELIFQRQVGVAKQESENPSARDTIESWWYGGFGANRQGEPRGNFRVGGSFSLPGGSGGQLVGAGMIGNGQGHRANCRENARRGINRDGKSLRKLVNRINRGNTCYWEGSQMGPNSFSFETSGVKDLWSPFGRRSSLPSRQFGVPGKNNYLGIVGEGQKESLRFSWSLPRGGTKAGFGFSLNGAPGIFYAVQVVGIDTREKIIPITRPASYTFGVDEGFSTPANSSQYFKVFMSAALPGGPGPNPDFQSDEAEVSTSLSSRSPVQTRQRTSIRVTLNSNDDELDYGASPLFPRETKLYHFTPQLEYSTAAAGTKVGITEPYSSEYISYEGLPQPVSNYRETAEPLYQPPFPAADSVITQVINLSRATRLKPIEQQVEDDVSERWRLAWLQPTLENPCQALAPVFPYQPSVTGWPERPDRCVTEDPSATPVVFNAWDDLVWSQSEWDAQHVIRKIDDRLSENEIGPIRGQLLRCNASTSGSEAVAAGTATIYQKLTATGQAVPGSTVSAPSLGSGNPNRAQYTDSVSGNTSRFESCRNAIYPLLPNVINVNNQQAQGIVDIQGAGGRGSALITLDTNRPEVVSEPNLSPMEEGLAIPEIVGDTEINRGDRVELNYCQQGLPAGASYRPAGSKWGQSVTSSQTGDPGCQGYALKFVYTTGGLEADQCLSESAARNQLWSNYGSMSHSAPVAGAYGQYDSDSRRDRAYGPLAGAPYTNNHLPWSQASTAGQCADYPNRYTTVGQWVVDREPQRGWGKFNAGAPIANGTYLASFSFDFGSETSALTATATSTVGGIGGDNGAEITGSTCPTLTGTNVRPGVCWSLKADYEGYVNLIRVSAYRKQPESQIDGQFIKVYGAKASR